MSAGEPAGGRTTAKPRGALAFPERLIERNRSAGRLGPLLAWAVVYADIGTSVYYVPGLLFGELGGRTPSPAAAFVLITGLAVILVDPGPLAPRRGIRAAADPAVRTRRTRRRYRLRDGARRRRLSGPERSVAPAHAADRVRPRHVAPDPGRQA